MRNLQKIWIGKKISCIWCVSLILLLIAATACEKDGYLYNLKRTGPNKIIDRTVNSVFENIALNDDINLVITQGDTLRVSIEGGANLLAGVETRIDTNTLIISNKNKLNWLRSYDKHITAYVTLPRLSQLFYNATSLVSCTDTIRCDDSLTITAKGGSGYIDLAVHADKTKLSIFAGCSADMKVSGFSGLTFIYAAGYGPFYCENLISDFVFMRSLSTNICKVYARERLEYEIQNIGDVIYYGHPAKLAGYISGKGKLIQGD